MEICHWVFTHSLQCCHCMEELCLACCCHQLNRGRILCQDHLCQGGQVNLMCSCRTQYSKSRPNAIVHWQWSCHCNDQLKPTHLSCPSYWERAFCHLGMKSKKGSHHATIPGIVHPSDDLTKALGWFLHSQHVCWGMCHYQIGSPQDSELPACPPVLEQGPSKLGRISEPIYDHVPVVDKSTPHIEEVVWS